MQSGTDDLVVRSVDVVGNVEKVSGKAREAVRLTHGIRVMIAAQRQRDLKVGTNAPFVVPVNAQAIHRDRLRATDGEVLRIADSKSVVKIQQVLSETVPDGANPRRVVRHVIAMKVYPELQRVVTLHLREIVDNPILGYVASLWPKIQIATEGRKSVSAKAKAKGNQCRCRGKAVGGEHCAVP